MYGPLKTIAVVIGLLVLGGLSASRLGVQEILWPMEIIVGLSLILIVIQPWKFKLVEHVAGFSLICHLWAAPIQSLLRGFK